MFPAWFHAPSSSLSPCVVPGPSQATVYPPSPSLPHPSLPFAPPSRDTSLDRAISGYSGPPTGSVPSENRDSRGHLPPEGAPESPPGRALQSPSVCVDYCVCRHSSPASPRHPRSSSSPPRVSFVCRFPPSPPPAVHQTPSPPNESVETTACLCCPSPRSIAGGPARASPCDRHSSRSHRTSRQRREVTGAGPRVPRWLLVQTATERGNRCIQYRAVDNRPLLKPTEGCSPEEGTVDRIFPRLHDRRSSPVGDTLLEQLIRHPSSITHHPSPTKPAGCRLHRCIAAFRPDLLAPLPPPIIASAA